MAGRPGGWGSDWWVPGLLRLVPVWLYPVLWLVLVLALDAGFSQPVATPPPTPVPIPVTTRIMPLASQNQPVESLAAAELTGSIGYRTRFNQTTLHLPFIAAAALPTVASPAVALPPPIFNPVRVPPVGVPQAAAPVLAFPAPTAAPAQPAQAEPLDESGCKVYRGVRITWYELGSCCDKAPGHPEYGVTRSGLPVAWGMAAVQARWPLVPLGTRIIVRDIGREYRFVITDTGSETAFGSNWVDIYVPTIPVGHWVERQVGSDGRSDVLVCP